MKWKRIVQAAVVLPLSFGVLGLSGCSDHDAQSDLPVGNQKLSTTDVQVDVFPDGFPNMAHKCRTGDVTVGEWTGTDRWVFIIYNDPLCPGYQPRAKILVLTNTARGVQQVESSDSAG